MDDYKTSTHFTRSKRILALAIPSSLQNIASMLTEIINLIFVGYLNNPQITAGVGMGNMTQNLCALSFILGFNSALDTLISQAAGAGKIELCGVYLNRGRFLMTALFLPIMIVLMNTERILVYIGQDPSVSNYA